MTVEVYGDRALYRWRQMTPEQRQEALDQRMQSGRPWHSPPHYAGDSSLYLMTATCYEHRHVIGKSPQRMAEFEKELLATTRSAAKEVSAWIVLPNHYHMLVHAPDVKQLLKSLGQLHGRTSFQWNGEEDRRSRQVWHNATETMMKSERHFWASLNYVLHNAVRYGYAQHWQDWPYCNAQQYLDDVGREEAERRWNEYPIHDYGKDWDPPDL